MYSEYTIVDLAKTPKKVVRLMGDITCLMHDTPLIVRGPEARVLLILFSCGRLLLLGTILMLNMRGPEARVLLILFSCGQLLLLGTILMLNTMSDLYFINSMIFSVRNENLRQRTDRCNNGVAM